MKTINFTKEDRGATMIDLSGRQPCWYANLEDGKNKNKAKWIVGIKDEGEKREYKFRVARIGDTSDQEFWAWATSLEFATEIMEVFKKGEKDALVAWIKEQKETE